MRTPLMAFTVAGLLAACAPHPGGEAAPPPPVVGAWVVRHDRAPFPVHMYVFNADGTLQQANPDAGDPATSDSDGKGVWRLEGSRVRGKFVEITADRATHRFVGRGEISFLITVSGDTFKGEATARFYDAEGRPTGAPVSTGMDGERVVLP